jgi:hypothetical protein
MRSHYYPPCTPYFVNIQSIGRNPETFMQVQKEAAADQAGRRFSCEECGEYFGSEDELISHEKNHATVEKSPGTRPS